MGSWLFVGAFSLYRRFASRSASGEENGYTAISTEENGDNENDAASVHSTTPINPVLKAMDVKENRIPLKGWKVALLTAPAATLMAREAISAINTAARAPEALQTIVGILLIAGAQIFTASQFVLEEHILEKYALEPLKVVGWEGLFGFSVTLVGMLVMHLAVGRTAEGKYGYFDIVEAWREVVGFGLLVYGTFLFNGLVRPPLERCVVRDYEELLPEEPIEHQ
ncbi:nucleotide-sugar transporter [Diplocarpon rosae]|nr:nucleotide-sugar transporter [Diplocarpon rosae]